MYFSYVKRENWEKMGQWGSKMNGENENETSMQLTKLPLNTKMYWSR